MHTCTDLPPDDNDLWENLYPLLLPKAKGWVYNSKVPAWQGQEIEVAWDIVHIGIERTFKYLHNAPQRNIVVDSPVSLSVTIAKNYYLDLRRRDQRLLHLDAAQYEQLSHNHLADPEEEALENVYEEELFRYIAQCIARFPTKMRAAILTDLANRMHFDSIPTALQQAFLDVGISLREYQIEPSRDPKERCKQSSLRSLGYKRLAELVYLRFTMYDDQG